MAAEQILVNGVTEIINKVLPVITQQISSAWGVKDDLRKLKDTLESIQALMSDAEKKQVNYDTVRLWLRRLKDVVYDADDVLDEFAYEVMRRDAVGGKLKHKVRDFVSPSNPLVFHFKMSRQIRGINAKLDEIYNENVRYSLNASGFRDNQTTEQGNRLTYSVVDDTSLLGRDDAKAEIINILSDKLLPPSSSSFNSSQQDKISTVSIVGMGGLGKTSLAQLVYNDESIGNYFELKMWVCISDDFDVSRILKNILESITGGACGDLSNLDVLANKVMESLTGKKYLLVLDDLWNEDAQDWEKLKNVLVFGGFGSKVLVTTRNQKVADTVGGIVHNLKKLSDHVCWSIIEKKVLSQGGAVLTSEMIKIGKDIAGKCDGLPLAAKSLGSLMCSKRNQSYWLSIANNNDLWSAEEHKKVISILKLSYDNLPAPLKQCFSYCCLFPKDWEINREMLIRLWMAEGFLVQSSGGLEDIGNEYFEYLVWSSFFQDVVRDEELGDITTCKMHDLVHDLALSITDCNEFVIGDGKRYGKEEISQVRRLRLPFDEQGGFSSDKLRTIIATASWDFRHIDSFLPHKRLRILCLLSVWDSWSLPSSISKLKHLRYLDFSCVDSFPKVSLDNSYNLQTLILHQCRNVPNWLLSKIETLKKLRHLDISKSDIKSIPDNIGSLKHLSFLDLSDTEISKLPDSITCISSLRTLEFRKCHNLDALPSELGALTQLRCLDFKGTSIKILPESCISNLSNLEMVKLGENCKLPKEIKNWPRLRIFTHGRFDDVMPRGIERLTCLEKLEDYMVRKENEICGSSGNNGIEELAGLNLLQVLCIRNLENLSGGKQGAETANLKDKQHLRKLVLKWGSTGDDEEVRNSRSVNDTTVLDGLQPHLNLKKLKIDGFSGVKLPKWMIGCSLSNCLPNLVELELYLDNCEKLPALGMLPFLRVLFILGMRSIKCLGEEFYHQQGNSNASKISSLFPSLVKLWIVGLENLEEWVAPLSSYSSCFPALETLILVNCKRLRRTPPIILFSSLKELMLLGTNDNAVNSLLNIGVEEGCLPSLTSIEIWESPDLIYLPPLGDLLQISTSNFRSLKIRDCSNFQGFRDDGDNRNNNNNTSFQSLRIYDCPVLASLPDLQLCTSIRSLLLYHCPVLTSLPDLRLCTSLRELTIWKCDKLNKESIPYDLKKSLTFLEDLRVDFIQRDEGGPDVSDWWELTNLMEKE
ncbi:putative disease resistance RPP13-like protein 1 [Papaver somniferum]|uniref:putative disease resistance RPP13-like protein 1 n=1 Tax=Papaver somniferum TaxID=3469 RepID=UPI000E6FCC0B|nr:putative disease resistance RPP13-like protein 1 [Papaver somniferum]